VALCSGVLYVDVNISRDINKETSTFENRNVRQKQDYKSNVTDKLL
jgi:hypothetical protein